MADPINKKTIENYQKQLALQKLAYAQQAANAANMSSYSSSIGLATGAGGPLNISNVPRVAGLANRQAVGETGANIGYEEASNRLKALPKFIEGQRQYLRWRYPTRYGIRKSNTATYPVPTPIYFQPPQPLPDVTTPKQGG